MKNLSCLLAIVALMSCAPLANATLQLSYQIGAGVPTVCNTGPDAGPVTCPTFTVGGVTITNFSGLSNSPGTPANAQEFDSTLQITNGNTSSVAVTLWTTAQNFANPTAPPFPILWSNEESLDGTTGTTTGQAIDCADTANSLAPPGTASFCGAPGVTLANVSETIIGASSASHTVTGILSSLTAPYSLSSQITLVLSAGATMHFQDSQILTPVPEPASILFFGTALLGAATMFRKRAGRRS